ncbi:TetR/AcrR family transcriptional regulator [Sporosarcina sp. P3]|uniref:TetR/AcrR family transcriptional regulator n=1 Tax=Sporosarcina TaxID=1569 RepID=UPI0009DC6D9F|nr:MULTISPECIES: TetR/AcrR family transcriptional regulator [Sporosarcina]ARF16142.1 TetR family transcriptional regulator [Sporosarcina ureae]PID20154.1 TetR/AcrR family transcriptional regulator [Sporosarcina sp. P3]
MTGSTRKIDILDAASKIVAEKGIFHLTIEAVAAEAGISKGGLLYHYKSKEVLVEKMVEHLARNYKTKINTQAEEDEKERGKFTRAYLDVTFKKGYPNKDMHSGLLAAKAINPILMRPIREAYLEWQHEVEEDGIDPVIATIIRLASDGIWLADLFDINPIRGEQKELVYKKLREWTAQ